MKDYIVTWELNKFGFHSRLERKYRTIYETKFTCEHLAELFSALNEFLKPYQAAYFPEVTNIKEV